MSSNPLVSVLMTAYNSEKFIEDAIASVLSSTYVNFELIIVNDCSTDTTESVCEKYISADTRVKYYLNEKNLGDYPNRNKAASYATGKYIKYLDADDIIYPHGLEVMVRAMEQLPSAGFGLCAQPDSDKPYPILLSPKEIYLEHFSGHGHFYRAPGSSIILKEAFDKVGGFSGERMIGDTDLWFKMAMYYPMAKIITYLYWDRQHAGQERQSQYAKDEYPRLQSMVLKRYFSHQDCPLNENEKAETLAKIKRKKLKTSIVSKLKQLLP